MADVTSSITTTTTTTTTAGPRCKLIPRQRRRRQRGRRRDEATTTRTVTTSIDYDAHDDVPGRAAWKNGKWVTRGGRRVRGLAGANTRAAAVTGTESSGKVTSGEIGKRRFPTTGE